MLSREWRCSWSSADRRCSNYIWVINNLIAYLSASYIRDLTVRGVFTCAGNGRRWSSGIMWIHQFPLVIRRASAKLENLFVTANFVSARAQLSKLERQQALPPNCGQIMKTQKLFIFSKCLAIHQTSTLHNTFYFNNTWTKIQLWSDPVNMQPDKTQCYPQRPITTYGLLPARCWVHLAEAPLRTVGHYH